MVLFFCGQSVLDLYIAEIYSPRTIFLLLILRLIFIHFYTASSGKNYIE